MADVKGVRWGQPDFTDKLWEFADIVWVADDWEVVNNAANRGAR